MTSDHQTPSKPRRRWFQFSLRTLLVAVALLGVLFAWLGPWTQSDRRKRHIEETIHKLGGSVILYWRGGAYFVRVSFSQRPMTDKKLKDLVELSQPKWLFITGLDLSACSVTNKSLEHLKGLTNLHTLNFTGTRVTDAGLVHLKSLTNLHGLSLNNTQVTDAGLEHLKGLSKLEGLDLHRTLVTDAGLEHLKGLTNLKTLSLSYTQVTDKGVKKLQQALPNCTIYH